MTASEQCPKQCSTDASSKPRTYVRNERNVRVQDSDKYPRLSYPANAVDNADPRRSRFIELNDSGWSAPEIAKELGVTARTIQRWRAASGRSQGTAEIPRPESLREQARHLLDEGVSFTEAAASVGVARKTIVRWFPDRQPWTHTEAAKFAAAVRRLNQAINERRTA